MVVVQGVSGLVHGCVGKGRVPGEEPCHHREREALVPLGPALHWLEERSGAGLVGPCTFSWLLTGTEPVIVLRVLLGFYTEPGCYSKPSFFQTGRLYDCQTVRLFDRQNV